MIYNYPQYYEVAFSFRNIPAEVDFMVTCMNRFSQIPVNRVFEIACGFAPHAGELALRGFRYLGLDNNRNMLDYAGRKWNRTDPRPEFIEADMVSFRAPVMTDFAYVMLGSLYANTPAELTSHFDAVAATLRPGGLYLLDWCIQFEDPLQYADNNAITLEQNGIRVESRFDIRLLDTDDQTYEEIWTLDINDRGRHQRLQAVERNRAIAPEEFRAFIRGRTDFEFVGWWKDWDLARPILDRSGLTRPVTLLRRR